LRGTGVARQYLVEIRGQALGGLAAAGGAIPGQLMSRYDAGQPCEQGRRISRAEGGVIAGDGRKVVFESIRHRIPAKKDGTASTAAQLGRPLGERQSATQAPR